VAAFALARLPLDSIPDIRRNPEPILGFDVSASAFKHLDLQTIAGLAAVCRAARDSALEMVEFQNWGVLAAPHFLGQPLMVSALNRFRTEGAWGVSPHVIPHHSLHAVAGTVSQVLKIHGPNLGISGGQGGTGEALLAAAAWIGRERVPGVWVVLTTLDPPAELGPEGELPAGSHCVGLAVALAPTRTVSAGLRLHILPDARRSDRSFDLFRLHAGLEHAKQARGTGTALVATGAPRVEIEWNHPVRTPLSAALLLRTAEVQSNAAARMSSGAEAER
jgi:hypothetical protein